MTLFSDNYKSGRQMEDQEMPTIIMIYIVNCILLYKLESFIGISTAEKNHTSIREKL